jgi:hypothetical protein
VDPLDAGDPTLPQLDDHVVRRVPAFRADKAYVCPGCDNTLPPGVGHVVAWPQPRPDDRRHWHLHCWRIAAGRGRL